jgi:hypothetical protein
MLFASKSEIYSLIIERLRTYKRKWCRRARRISRMERMEEGSVIMREHEIK